ncbi:MAG: ribosome recycling factor [Parcubacteria group bacterium]|nr:ribosome recycling factor [Parcubacteria group bacterium]
MTETLLKELELKFAALIDDIKRDFSSLRGGRAMPKLVEDVKVDYFGQMMTVKQLGSISVSPPREIVVSIWDRNAVSAVAKAIEEATQLSAAIDGGLVRINLPPLTEERKKDIVKIAKAKAEDIRIRVRTLRDEANKAAGKACEDKEIGEDEKFKLKEKIQAAVDARNSEIERLLEKKTAEINE